MRTVHGRRDPGFTLLEIVVAVVLVGIVSAVAIVGVGSLTRSGSAASCSASLDAARTALTVETVARASADSSIGFDDLVTAGAMTVPDGAVVAPDGSSITTNSWTLLLTDGPASLTCLDGSLWTPAELGTAVVFWLDATAVGGSDGDRVGTWSSRAPSARTAATTMAAWQPTLASTGIAGRPAVRFDGVDDRLSFDGAFLARTDFTVAAVTAREAAFGRGYYLGSMGTSVPGTAFILGYDADTVVRYSHRNDGINASFPGFTAVVPSLHVGISGTSGRSLWIDGTARGTAGPLRLTTWSDAHVGRDSAGFFRGVVGEVVMVTSALSGPDRQRLEGYLAWRWGTVAALPVGHPYRSAPPVV